MQNQSFKKDSNSEEIYQEMTRDAFGFFLKKKFQESENLILSDYPEKDNIPSESEHEKLKQSLLNIFSAELQTILPGAFQIMPQDVKCLSYSNLNSWSPGRAYFSLFEMKKFKSIWILHLSRSVGEGLAYLVRKEKYEDEINIYENLQEADSLIYLEIGVILRKLFSSIIKIWPENEGFKIIRCRHILQLGFQKVFNPNEKYFIFPFLLKNKDCEGYFHIIFPSKYFKKITNF